MNKDLKFVKSSVLKGYKYLILELKIHDKFSSKTSYKNLLPVYKKKIPKSASKYLKIVSKRREIGSKV